MLDKAGERAPAAVPARAHPARLHAHPFFGRLNLEVRQDIGAWHQALILAGAIALGLAITAVILVWAGVEPGALIDELIVQTLFDPRNLSAVLVHAGPLVMVGLAAAVAFRVRFWNIGIEGQMIWGAIGATFVSIHDIGPESTRLVLMIVAAALCGMAWILPPALLRIRLGVNEIISTLLLNYVAFDFLLHLLYGAWQDPKSAFPHSLQFDPVERLPKLGWEELNFALPLALLFALAAAWLMLMSRFGLFMKFIHANDRMALAVGVPVVAVGLGATLISGALSGIGGFVIAAGLEYRLTQAFFLGYGFSGILIAFLARNNPLAAVVVAVLVAVLFVAGQSLEVFYQVPSSTVQLIQAIIVMCVASSEFLIRHRVHWIR